MSWWRASRCGSTPGTSGCSGRRSRSRWSAVPGVANRYFGGDAHYFAELSGPGTVWLQSMPLPQLAASLVPYLPAAQDRPEPVEGGLVGGIMGDVLT